MIYWTVLTFYWIFIFRFFNSKYNFACQEFYFVANFRPILCLSDFNWDCVQRGENLKNTCVICTRFLIITLWWCWETLARKWFLKFKRPVWMGSSLTLSSVAPFKKCIRYTKRTLTPIITELLKKFTFTLAKIRYSNWPQQDKLRLFSWSSAQIYADLSRNLSNIRNLWPWLGQWKNWPELFISKKFEKTILFCSQFRRFILLLKTGKLTLEDYWILLTEF